MEVLANALSPAAKPVLTVYSPSHWMLHSSCGITKRSMLFRQGCVGKGKFTVDADRATLAGVISRLIAARKAYALATDDLFFYRVLHVGAKRILEGTGGAEGNGGGVGGGGDGGGGEGA